MPPPCSLPVPTGAPTTHSRAGGVRDHSLPRCPAAALTALGHAQCRHPSRGATSSSCALSAARSRGAAGIASSSRPTPRSLLLVSRHARAESPSAASLRWQARWSRPCWAQRGTPKLPMTRRMKSEQSPTR
eukprot:4473792-Prymnesium_polylepis.1